MSMFVCEFVSSIANFLWRLWFWWWKDNHDTENKDNTVILRPNRAYYMEWTLKYLKIIFKCCFAVLMAQTQQENALRAKQSRKDNFNCWPFVGTTGATGVKSNQYKVKIPNIRFQIPSIFFGKSWNQNKTSFDASLVETFRKKDTRLKYLVYVGETKIFSYSF